MIVKRKFYLYKGIPAYSHSEYKPGFSDEDIANGVARPVMNFKSYPESNLEPGDLVEITEDEYKNALKTTSESKLNSRKSSSLLKIKAFNSAKEKLKTLGFNDDEIKVIFNL